jgi:PAS domain S-box-containing protein
MSAFDEFDVCRNILESLLTGVCVVDVQKKILFWSTGAERITGHLRHEVIGRTCIAKALLHCEQSGLSSAGRIALWLERSRQPSRRNPQDFFITNPGAKFRFGFARFPFTMRAVRLLARLKPSRPLSKARSAGPTKRFPAASTMSRALPAQHKRNPICGKLSQLSPNGKLRLASCDFGYNG